MRVLEIPAGMVPVILTDGPARGRIAAMNAWDRQIKVAVPEPDPWRFRRFTYDLDYQVARYKYCRMPQAPSPTLDYRENTLLEGVFDVYAGWSSTRPNQAVQGEFLPTALARLGKIPWDDALQATLAADDAPITPVHPVGDRSPQAACHPEILTFRSEIMAVCSCWWLTDVPVPARRLPELVWMIRRHAPELDLGYLYDALARGDYTNLAPAPETEEGGTHQ